MGDDKESPKVDKIQYQRLAGKLIYLAHTRLDMAYAISVVNQFMHDPKVWHLQAVNRILHYLKITPRRGVLLKRGGNLSIGMYTNVIPIRLVINRSLIFGYCMFLGGNLVTWRNKK